MNKEQLQKLYLDYLKEEGFTGYLDEDGDIEFKYEGDKYFLYIDENDTEYFRIQAVYGCELSSEEDVIKHLEAANAVNADYKLGKIFIREEKELVLLETSLFLANPDNFKPFFKRCLGILQSMISDFAEKFKDDE
ncbi:MAG: YbjN domain-containing protein [Treponema sp.]|nr:YbjN domain-containing protein [Treponema sp.]